MVSGYCKYKVLFYLNVSTASYVLAALGLAILSRTRRVVACVRRSVAALTELAER